jgi:hypothetical protein
MSLSTSTSSGKLARSTVVASSCMGGHHPSAPGRWAVGEVPIALKA